MKLVEKVAKLSHEFNRVKPLGRRREVYLSEMLLVIQESTKEAEVIGVAERSGQGGLKVYEFEYRVDSTRGGMKRIFSAAFVASKKLYLLNISHSDKPESPLDMQTKMMLEQILHSFDTASLV